MKPGDPIRCPHCGADSFLKKESVMDGWTKLWEVLKCVSCSAIIADCAKQEPPERKKAAASDRLKQFLGVDGAEPVKVSLSEDDRRFCKDCANIVPHPFQLRCALTGKSVNPMDDCPEYQKKEASGSD